MIESLIEELSSGQKNKSGERDEFSESPDQKYSENAFLSALPVVQKIVRSKTLFSIQSDTSDLVQSIALRLWKWREKHGEKSADMSSDDWKSFAARTAFNEVNRYFSSKTLASNVPLDEASAVAASEFIEGQTEFEFYSLAREVWQEICRLSLRQRRALLLSSQELIYYLLKSGVKEDQMKEILEITNGVWDDIKSELSLPDARIAEILQEMGNTKNPESLKRSIRKARHEARCKLQELMKK
ncbi:MAG: hypothetical protein ACR2MD_05595 [Aridibacter sp.]